MKRLVWLMGKPGSGKTTLGQLLAEQILDSVHFSFGELLKEIQETPNPEGYTLGDRQRVYDFLKEKSADVRTMIVDGNPYPPTNFDRRRQLDDLFDTTINIHLTCDDESALKRLEERNREVLLHEGIDNKARILNFNTIVLPEIKKAEQKYTVLAIDTNTSSKKDLVEKILTVLPS